MQRIAENLGLSELSETTLNIGYRQVSKRIYLFRKEFIQNATRVSSCNWFQPTLLRYLPLSHCLGKKALSNQFLIYTPACLSTAWMATREGESSRTRSVAGKPSKEIKTVISKHIFAVVIMLRVGQTDFTLIKSNASAVYEIHVYEILFALVNYVMQ